MLEKFHEKGWPCFLCGEILGIRRAKTGKPYFICDPCGLQAFIRKEKGIRKLGELLESDRKELRTPANNQTLALIGELEAVKAKLGEIRDKKGAWGTLFPSEETTLLENSLKSEIKAIRAKLKARPKILGRKRRKTRI